MYLKQLEIQGFKSFAKKTVLEFDRGMTAIVGPNGSGKSNVADSLRWVLGEQSTKLLRGKKSDDVIFAGSDKRGKSGFAEVIATFDNSDGKIPLDAAEVSFGRRIDRSGQSEYLINGVKVRLLDIIDTVLKSNIGTSRYTVIGQGTIDQMILAGPPEIKNLIDEASGVKTYYIRRDKTLRRLEVTATNLMRAEDTLAELEPRVKSLRRQAKRMEARETIQTELQHLQTQYFGHNFGVLARQNFELSQQLQQITEQRKQLEQSIEAHVNMLAQKENENAEQLSRVRDIQHEIDELQRQKNVHLEQISMIQGKLQAGVAGGGDASKLQAQISSLKNAQRELLQKQAAEKRVLEEQRLIETQLQETISNLQTQINSLYESTPHARAHHDSETHAVQLSEISETLHRLTEAIAAEQWNDVRLLSKTLQTTWKTYTQQLEASAITPEQLQLHQSQLREMQNQKDGVVAQQQRVASDIAQARANQQFVAQQITRNQEELEKLEIALAEAKTTTVSELAQTMEKKQGEIQEQLEILQNKISKKQAELENFYNIERAWKTELNTLEQEFRKNQLTISQVRDRQAALQVQQARFETQAQNLQDAAAAALGQTAWQEIKAKVHEFADHELPADVVEKIQRLEKQLLAIGGVDETTMSEYRETEARYSSLLEQVTDLKSAMNDLKAVIDELDEHIKKQFTEAFHKINEKFSEYFQVLFNGGKAYLSLVKEERKKTESLPGVDSAESNSAENQPETSQPLRPEEAVVQKYEKGALGIVGVDIKATPAGKKLTSIQALSGGERSLTSIALLCSLLTCYPSPFVVLDEVDAALDDANTIRFAEILSRLLNHTQFITITHNRETMVQSNTLYGVTMGDDGVSKLLGLKMDQAGQYAK